MLETYDQYYLSPHAIVKREINNFTWFLDSIRETLSDNEISQKNWSANKPSMVHNRLFPTQFRFNPTSKKNFSTRNFGRWNKTSN